MMDDVLAGPGGTRGLVSGTLLSIRPKVAVPYGWADDDGGPWVHVKPRVTGNKRAVRLRLEGGYFVAVGLARMPAANNDTLWCKRGAWMLGLEDGCITADGVREDHLEHNWATPSKGDMVVVAHDTASGDFTVTIKDVTYRVWTGLTDSSLEFVVVPVDPVRVLGVAPIVRMIIRLRALALQNRAQATEDTAADGPLLWLCSCAPLWTVMSVCDLLREW